jgi:hypothetical protein
VCEENRCETLDTVKGEVSSVLVREGNGTSAHSEATVNKKYLTALKLLCSGHYPSSCLYLKPFKIFRMDVFATKRGSKLAMKMYRNRTHARRYLHLNPNHPYQITRGVFRSLIIRAKDICQDQKNLNNEIINIRHDLMLH